MFFIEAVPFYIPGNGARGFKRDLFLRKDSVQSEIHTCMCALYCVYTHTCTLTPFHDKLPPQLHWLFTILAAKAPSKILLICESLR